MKAESVTKSAIKARPNDSVSTRSRIFEAAKVRFSQTSYEAVGVRDIAGDAGVDAALVMRYFGSKEGLFRKITSEAFSGDLLEGDEARLVDRILHQLVQPLDEQGWRTGYDPLRLLLCSINSATAGPIVSRAFRETFVERLAGSLSGRNKEKRAALISSYILGVALLRVSEPQNIFAGTGGRFVQQCLRDALKAAFNKERVTGTVKRASGKYSIGS